MGYSVMGYSITSLWKQLTVKTGYNKLPLKHQLELLHDREVGGHLGHEKLLVQSGKLLLASLLE